MLIDARTEPGLDLLRGQVCIIGSGAAGITVALELIEAGLDVVVLEGGGLGVEPSAQDTYRGHLHGDTAHDPLELVRQKRLGGTTWQWGGRCAPLDALDLETRPWVPGSGWPISLDDLLPYYRRAHHYCDLGDFAYAAGDALAAVAPFVTAGAPCAITDEDLWRWSPPVKFGRRYRRSLAEAGNARALYHANVVRLERDPGDGRIARAVVATAPGRHVVVEAATFVLAAGGLESARLLLASRGEGDSGVGNENDLVGRFYMTHPVAEVGEVTFRQPARARAGAFMQTRDGVYCRRMMKLSEEAQRGAEVRNLAAALWYPDPRNPVHGDGLLSAFALVRAGMAQRRLDWKSAGVHRRYAEIVDVPAHLHNVVGDLPRIGRYGATWVRRRLLARRSLPSFMVDHGAAPSRLRFDAEQSPDPENRVILGRDRDGFGVPRLELRYRVSDDDRSSIVRSLGVISDEFARLGVGEMRMPQGSDGMQDIAFGDGTHQMGLTRMATSPRQGVVDRECRVHGAPNLYVASSSVFPTSGSVGPTLTIVALAVRAADSIRRELRAPVPVRQAVDAPGGLQP